MPSPSPSPAKDATSGLHRSAHRSPMSRHTSLPASVPSPSSPPTPTSPAGSPPNATLDAQLLPARPPPRPTSRRHRPSRPARTRRPDSAHRSADSRPTASRTAHRRAADQPATHSRCARSSPGRRRPPLPPLGPGQHRHQLTTRSTDSAGSPRPTHPRQPMEHRPTPGCTTTVAGPRRGQTPNIKWQSKSPAEQRQDGPRPPSRPASPTRPPASRQHAQDQTGGKANTSTKPSRDAAHPNTIMSSAQLWTPPAMGTCRKLHPQENSMHDPKADALNCPN